MCASSKACVQVAQRQDRCVVVRLSIWKTGSLLAREYFDPGKGPVRLPTPALPGCSPSSSHSMCVRSLLWYSELDPVPESIQAVAARCRARAGALQGEVRPVVVLRGEDGTAQAQAREGIRTGLRGVEDKSSASAREAPLVENRGESRASMATTKQQPLCHASPGRERVGQKTDAAGFEEIEENDTMSEGSFCLCRISRV